MDKINEYIEALRNGKGFDWICNHGNELNKYELIDIVKELDYAIYDNLYDFDQKEVYEAAADELNDMYYYDEEE